MIAIYKEAGEKANVRDYVRCSPHDMRHTYASEMIKQTDIYTVSKLLGHANVGITENYLRTLSSGN